MLKQICSWFASLLSIKEKDPSFLLPESISHYRHLCDELKDKKQKDLASIRTKALRLENIASSRDWVAKDEGTVANETASPAKKELALRKVRTLTEEAKTLRKKASGYRKLARWLEWNGRMFDGEFILEKLPLPDKHNYTLCEEVARRKAMHKEWETIRNDGVQIFFAKKRKAKDEGSWWGRTIVRYRDRFFLFQTYTPSWRTEGWTQFVTESREQMDDAELNVIAEAGG